MVTFAFSFLRNTRSLTIFISLALAAASAAFRDSSSAARLDSSLEASSAACLEAAALDSSSAARLDSSLEASSDANLSASS